MSLPNSLHSTPSPTTGGHDDNPVVVFIETVFLPSIFDLAFLASLRVLADPLVQVWLSVLAAFQSVRPMDTILRQD